MIHFKVFYLNACNLIISSESTVAKYDDIGPRNTFLSSSKNTCFLLKQW